ncbi:MAG: TonB-dependent receptor [Proteobacteria bacterium]|nr:TonB-dependent receptor [Pseudomonadota bacterium]
MSIRRQSIYLSLLGWCAGGIAAAADAPTAAEFVDSGELMTVTVTAQHRTEVSQDVPITLQVVNAVQIDKLAATDLASMSGYIPGLQVSGDQPTQPGYTLRGISVSDFGIGTDSPIGIYQDGVYAGKTGGALLLFNDVQRIEVLKGPQGTLFGRNSAAGAISVISNEPTDVLSADAKARWGNYGSQYYEGMVNGQIAPGLDGRVSFVSNRSKGWLQDAETGVRYERDGDWGVRAQLLWHGPADTNFRVIYEHENLAQPPRPAIGIANLPPAPGLPPYPTDPANWLSPFQAPLLSDTVNPRESRTYDGVTLRIEHSFSFGDLTSISGYRHFNTYNREEQDGTNRIYLYFDDVNIEQNKSFTQEISLGSKSALADWVTGVSYYYDDAHQDSQVNLYTDSIDTLLTQTQLLPGGIYGPISQAAAEFGIPVNLLGNTWQENMYNHGYSRALAAYADVIWHIAPKWNLTTGIRFTHDEKDFSWYSPTRTANELDAGLAELAALGFPLPPFPYTQNIAFNFAASLNAPLRYNDSWNDTSPRVVLDFKPQDNLMYYLSYAKGYQAGGYNALSPGAKYNPEKVNNYELGMKSEYFDHKLLVNASAYYYDYTNLQNLYLQNPAGEIPSYQVTISDVHAWGADLETHWQATEGLRLNLIATYIDSTYKDFLSPTGRDLSGQATGVPFWQIAGGLDYVVHDVINGDVDFTLQDAYVGPGRCNADSPDNYGCLTTPFKTNEATNRTDVRLAWVSHSRVPVTVAVFANNVFDKRYVTGVQNISVQTLGTPFASVSAPRFWGVELGAHF